LSTLDELPTLAEIRDMETLDPELDFDPDVPEGDTEVSEAADAGQDDPAPAPLDADGREP
jgi:hypothetical protein